MPFRGLRLIISMDWLSLVSVVVTPIIAAAPLILFPRPVMAMTTYFVLLRVN